MIFYLDFLLEDVVSAGVIIPDQTTGKLWIYNKTGHYKVTKHDLDPVILILSNKNYEVINLGSNTN